MVDIVIDTQPEIVLNVLEIVWAVRMRPYIAIGSRLATVRP